MDDLVESLRSQGLLTSTSDCTRCGKNMKQIRRTKRIDGVVWYCSACHKEESIRMGSFFAHFRKVKLEDLYSYVVDWTIEVFKPRRSKLSKVTTDNISNDIMDISEETLTREPITRLGGSDIKVEIDKSLFRHRKYNRTRGICKRWVFGILDTQYTPARALFFVVKNRSKLLLQGIINSTVAPGSIIYFDGWRAYSGLAQNGRYGHFTVNHKRHFVDPITGCNTNGIESAWRWAKVFVKNFRVRTDLDLYRFLRTFIWFIWKAEPSGDSFKRLVRDIKQIYPV